MSDTGPNDPSSQPPLPGEGAPQRISIRLDDDQKFGAYANLLVVSHSPHDFTLDFCQMMPKDGKMEAQVVSRVKVAPTMVGKIIRTLNSNLTGYEDKFGMVKEVG